MRGRVHSGGTAGNVIPVAGARVALLEATSLAPVTIGEATTDGSGAFVLHPSKTTTDGVFYVLADRGGDYVLMALLGSVLPDEIIVNELTTVAAVYCGARFLHGRSLRGDPFGLRVAAGMNANLVTVADGTSSPVLRSSPNADQTNSLRSTRALANLAASCFRDGASSCAALFELATAPGQEPPTDIIGALFNIARYPANNAGSLFSRSQAVPQVYQPALVRAPDAWTLAVKVNDSGKDAHPFGGPANIAFDRYGRAWIANNVIQGTGESTQWCIVLEADGRPSPISPFTGGGLLGAGFGIDIGPDDHVWIGNFGWGGVDPEPAGSVSVFTLDGFPHSPAAGFQNDTQKVQGTVVDPNGNVWLASYGNHCVVVYLNGDPKTAIVYDGGGSFAPFGIALASDGTAWVSNTNGDTTVSSIVHLRLHGQTLQLLDTIVVGKTNKGMAIDSIGTIWVASGGDSTVYAFDETGSPLGAFGGGGMSGPWGISVDGDDHVWVANFGPLQPGDVFSGRLTQLAGANPRTIPSGMATGDPLSPDSGYTLHDAGEQVLLHNGDPLYGPGADPCFIPLMRMTSANVDAAGNVWTCNNWKPDFNLDAFGEPLRDVPANPGGDGIVIFVGLASPLAV